MEGNSQTPDLRKVVESFDREFARLHDGSRAIIEQTSPDILYAAGNNSSRPSTTQLPSIGESVLRSAAVVEQTFGGITANLWDDPFEWTLPEHLSSPEKVREHLTEVESMRQRAFSSFVDDGCLAQHIAMPSSDTQPLINLLLETLLRATAHQAQAQFVLKMLSRNRPPGFII